MQVRPRRLRKLCDGSAPYTLWSLDSPLALLILRSAFSLLAQEFRATLTGLVTDASGSAVPNVAVTARNVDTNEASTSVSTNQGSCQPSTSPGLPLKLRRDYHFMRP
jgi:hypothetical protein